jgi:hypothetical protein
MKNRLIAILALACLSFGTARASETDSVAPAPTPAPTLKATAGSPLEQFLHYGFHIGTDFLLGTRELSDYDHLDRTLSGTFGLFVRGGYRFIFAEVGLNYMFFKGNYEAKTFDFISIGKETVESRYLQIPVKAVGYIPLGKQQVCALMPNVGIIYQPLIHFTKNDIRYGKNNLMEHQFLLHAGLGFRFKFFNVEVAYKKSLRPFYSDRESVKPSYLALMVGFQF